MRLLGYGHGEQAHKPDAYAEDLTKAEASKRIDELKQSLGLE
ncbi:DUF3072 domain-containing protein [Rhizobium laguerreae]|nr:DUF3072 domain-containing protein [Rhizobium laguerreae]